MRSFYKLLGVGILMIATLGACAPKPTEEPVVAEGVLLSVEYRLEDGKTGGFTRLNSIHAVPGGNGSWNVDAYGRLTRDFLIITRPQRKDLGPQVIPANRLVNVQFYSGTVPVDESNSAKPE